MGLDYGTMLMSSFTNKIFLILIFYPCFIVMFTLIYQYINQSYSLLLRLKTRKKYALFCMMTVFIMTIFLFLQAFIIALICCNVVSHSDFKLTNNLKYPVNDFIIILISILKVFLTSLVIGFLNLLLCFKFHRKNINVIVLMFYLIFLFFSDRFYPSGFFLLDVFNPGFHSHGYDWTRNLFTLVGTGFIYFVTVLTILLHSIVKSSKNIKIGVN